MFRDVICGVVIVQQFLAYLSSFFATAFTTRPSLADHEPRISIKHGRRVDSIGTLFAIKGTRTAGASKGLGRCRGMDLEEVLANATF